MIGQRLETHLEAKGHDIHGAEGQEEAPLEFFRKAERDQNERPLQSKGKTDVFDDVGNCRRFDDVTPMEEGMSSGLYAAGFEESKLRQSYERGHKSQRDHSPPARKE